MYALNTKSKTTKPHAILECKKEHFGSWITIFRREFTTTMFYNYVLLVTCGLQLAF